MVSIANVSMVKFLWKTRQMDKIMLNDASILKLGKKIVKRFEHNMQDGVLFLFDVDTDAIWSGNEASNELIKLVDGKRSLKEIYENLIPLYEGYEYSQVKQSFKSIINELISKSFLEIVIF